MPVTQRKAKNALKTLQDYGRQRFHADAEVSQGEALGMGIASFADCPTVVDAAIAALEDWNGHLSVAALAAIEKGQGEVKRDGRTLTIILPEWWDKPPLNRPVPNQT